MTADGCISLKRAITRQIIRWSAVGMALSAAFAVLLVCYFGVAASESHIQTIALAAVKAFRHQVLAGDVRSAELQIHEAFGLKSQESVIIREPGFKPYYSLGAGRANRPEEAPCRALYKVCWYLGQNRIVTMVPIYFDGNREELFGYLELSLAPRFDWGLITSLFWLICASILVQALGLATKLIGFSEILGDRLHAWGIHVKEHPSEAIPVGQAPFLELAPMQEALAGLHSEIRRLESEARTAGQITLLRGIGHDLLTPVSQLRKYVTTLSYTLRAGQAVDPELIQGMERALSRLTSLGRLIRSFRGDAPVEKGSAQGVELTWVRRELEQIVKDFQNEDEVTEKALSLQLEVPFAGDRSIPLPPGDFQRILDNLIRNAVHACEKCGQIRIQAAEEAGNVLVTVQDNGRGIAAEIQDRVFDLDFSTKAAKGTGLGLPIVKQLCEQSGARIQFASSPGVGASFQISFRAVERGAVS